MNTGDSNGGAIGHTTSEIDISIDSYCVRIMMSSWSGEIRKLANWRKTEEKTVNKIQFEFYIEICRENFAL